MPRERAKRVKTGNLKFQAKKGPTQGWATTTNYRQSGHYKTSTIRFMSVI